MQKCTVKRPTTAAISTSTTNEVAATVLLTHRTMIGFEVVVTVAIDVDADADAAPNPTGSSILQTLHIPYTIYLHFVKASTCMFIRQQRHAMVIYIRIL